MRVVQLLGSSAGGVSQHVAQISRLLVNEPSMDVVIAAPENLREKFAPITGFRAVNIADRPGPTDLQTVGHLKAVLSGTQIVHAHGLRAGAMAGIAVRAISKKARPKLVVTLHNMPVGSWKIQFVSQVLERIVSFSADAVLGVSMDIVERMRSKRAKVYGRALVPAPVLAEPSRSTEQTRREVLVKQSAKMVLTIARLAPQKGLDTVVQASALLAEQGVEHEWVIAGDGPLEGELGRQIEESGAPVRLLGRRSDIADLLHCADVVVNAAVWEGQPVAVQEALRAGRALVVTDAGGTREVADRAALYVEVSNPEAMKIAVGEILKSDDLKESLEKLARKRSAQLPTEREVLHSLTELYARV